MARWRGRSDADSASTGPSEGDIPTWDAASEEFVPRSVVTVLADLGVVPDVNRAELGAGIPTVERLARYTHPGGTAHAVEQISAVTPDGAVWMPLNVDMDGTWLGQLLRWDPIANTFSTHFAPATGYWASVVYMESTRMLYIADNTNDQVWIVDPASPNVSAGVVTGLPTGGVYSLIGNPHNNKLYVFGGNATPSVIDLADLSVAVVAFLDAMNFCAPSVPTIMPDGQVLANGADPSDSGLVLIDDTTIVYFSADNHGPGQGHYFAAVDAILVALDASLVVTDSVAPDAGTGTTLLGSVISETSLLSWGWVLHPDNGFAYAQSQSAAGLVDIATPVGAMRWIGQVDTGTTKGPYGCFWHPTLKRVIALHEDWDANGLDLVVMT